MPEEPAKITIEFDEEKLYALERELKKEQLNAAQFLGRALDELYENKVPDPVREYIDSKAAAKVRRPPRQTSKSASVPGTQNTQEAQHEQTMG